MTPAARISICCSPTGLSAISHSVQARDIGNAYFSVGSKWVLPQLGFSDNSAPGEYLQMEHFQVCSNSNCNLIVDLRLNGTGVTLAVLPRCPVCGKSWSTKHPVARHKLGALAKRVPLCPCCVAERRSRRVLVRSAYLPDPSTFDHRGPLLP
jgi:hypothetical protein